MSNPTPGAERADALKLTPSVSLRILLRAAVIDAGGHLVITDDAIRRAHQANAPTVLRYNDSANNRVIFHDAAHTPGTASPASSEGPRHGYAPANAEQAARLIDLILTLSSRIRDGRSMKLGDVSIANSIRAQYLDALMTEWSDAIEPSPISPDLSARLERARGPLNVLAKLIRPDNGRCNQCGGEWNYRLDGSWNYAEGEHRPDCIGRQAFGAPSPASETATIAPLQSDNGFPRRDRADLYWPAERAIRAAVQAVEEAGADVALTDAVNLLHKAHGRVADFVDAQVRAGVAPPVDEARDELIQLLNDCADDREQEGHDAKERTPEAFDAFLDDARILRAHAERLRSGAAHV